MLDKITEITIRRRGTGRRWKAYASALKEGAVRKGNKLLIPIGFGSAPKKAMNDFISKISQQLYSEIKEENMLKKTLKTTLKFELEIERCRNWTLGDFEAEIRKETRPMALTLFTEITQILHEEQKKKDSFESQTLIEQAEEILVYIKQDPFQTLIPGGRVKLLERTLREESKGSLEVLRGEGAK